MVCVGDETPAGLEPLIAAAQDPAKAAAWRTSFARLGQGVQAQWQAGHYAADAARSATRVAALSEELSAAAAARTHERDQARAEAAERQANLETQQNELNAATSRADRATQEAERLRSELQLLEQERNQARAEAAERLRSELQLLEQERNQARAEAAERQANLEAQQNELNAAESREVMRLKVNLADARRAHELSEIALAKERRKREKIKLSILWRTKGLIKAIVRPFRHARRVSSDHSSMGSSAGLGRHKNGDAITPRSEGSND